MIPECIDHGDIPHLFCPLASSPDVYYSQRDQVKIGSIPLADGEVTHADIYHDVEVLIVDVSGVKVAYYPVHLISLC